MELAQIIGHYCRAHGLRLATAESCTGGRLSACLTAVAGASHYFASGVVSYTDEAKVALLGVLPATLARHTAVSEAVACEMAEGVAQRLGADLGIATTGYLGPSAGADATPVGTVYIGISYRGKSYATRLALEGPRTTMADTAVREALRLVWRVLYTHQSL